MSRIKRTQIAMLAVAGTAMSLQAQVVLFDAGPHNSVNWDATNTGTYAATQLGFSSGNFGAPNTERWAAAPFTLFGASTITEIRVNGFVPAGSEVANLNWIIWNRSGNNPPTVQAASGTVPYPAPVDDPRLPTGYTYQHRIVPTTPPSLPAGDYYLTVYGDQAGVGNTTGQFNFAWFANSQVWTALCPVNTPITQNNGSAFYFYRQANLAGGFTQYTLPITQYTVNPNPAYGPNPQDAQYLFSLNCQIIGTGTVATGACCLPAGGCSLLSAADCCTQQGAYQGDGTNCGTVSCPEPGACCLFDGSCISTLPANCANQGGVFQGANTLCGSVTCTAFGFDEDVNDAGDLPNSAALVNGNGQPLTVIFGTLTLDDVDLFRFKVCDEANFSATTVGTGTSIDTMLFMFDLSGVGLVMSDDTSAAIPQFSTITSDLITANGEYYIGMSSFNNTTLIGRMPIDATSQQLFTATNPANGFVYPEWGPTGPGAANPVAGWTGAASTLGESYSILLTGSCFLGGGPAPCYANCDGSGGSPLLTANDFSCFLNKYVNGDTYANCDGVGGLTANDFSCFLGKYVAGCS